MTAGCRIFAFLVPGTTVPGYDTIVSGRSTPIPITPVTMLNNRDAGSQCLPNRRASRKAQTEYLAQAARSTASSFSTSLWPEHAEARGSGLGEVDRPVGGLGNHRVRPHGSPRAFIQFSIDAQVVGEDRDLLGLEIHSQHAPVVAFVDLHHQQAAVVGDGHPLRAFQARDDHDGLLEPFAILDHLVDRARSHIAGESDVIGAREGDEVIAREHGLALVIRRDAHDPRVDGPLLLRAFHHVDVLADHDGVLHAIEILHGSERFPVVDVEEHETGSDGIPQVAATEEVPLGGGLHDLAKRH